MNRYTEPIGSVTKLISNLVKSLFQQVGAKQDLDFLPGAREVRGLATLRQVGSQERVADPTDPEAGAGLEGVEVLAADDGALGLAEDHGVRRVVEGAEHAGHVAQGAALDAPLAQGA